MKCLLIITYLLTACWADEPAAIEPAASEPLAEPLPDALAQESAAVAQESYSWGLGWPKMEYRAEPQIYPQESHEPVVSKDKRIGRHGLGFEKRYARAAGLMMPITDESIQHVGFRPLKKEYVYSSLYENSRD